MTSVWFGLIISLLTYHPYFVSIFEVEHNPETKTLQVAAKIFISDLEDALANEGKADIFIGTEKEHSEADIWITEYILKHFHLLTDGNAVEFTLVGKEVETDVIWCYLESKQIDNIDESLTVSADLLIDEFPTQTNIVHLRIWGRKQSVILRKGKTEKVLLYSELH